ncbi:MCE family protein [Aeromicrobium panaciterrae]|uniref:MCE family protein n=1 Tax=Aeromicrobium panaciterrae TaxID=363861 RepID=UPI0031D90B3E
MSRRLRLVVAAFLALALSGCTFNGIYDLPLPGNKVSKDNGFEVSAEFADALNVVPRSAVMVGDVPVGQVEEIVRSGWNAKITMLVRDDVVLPDNAVAEIRQTSLLGEKYVELSAPVGADGKPAGVGRLGPNDVIPMDRTGRNPEVEEVLGALSFVLTGGGLGQLQTITRELNAMMDGRTDKMRSVLNQVNTLVGTLDSQKGDIVRALESINGLSRTLVNEKETIGAALDAAGPAINVLRDQHTQLVGMLSELDKLGVVGTRVVNETKDDLVAELRHLEPVLRNLSDADDSLVPGLVSASSYPFPIDAGDTVKGDFANVIFQMQFKLTPVSEGGLIPTTLDEVVTLCRGLPTAPICSLGSAVIDPLCALLPTLPLCEAADPESIAKNGQPDSLLHDLLGSTPSGGAGEPRTEDSTANDNGLVELIGGLLGGGSR